MKNPQDRVKIVKEFFEKFEKEEMMDVFSFDETINKGYNEYLSKYRDLKNKLISNVGKVFPIHNGSGKTDADYLNMDINSFIVAHGKLIDNCVAPGTNETIRLSIAVCVLNNQNRLTNTIKDLHTPQEDNKDFSFKSFFSKLAGFKNKEKNKVIEDKIFSSEQTKEYKRLHYPDSCELIKETNLKYISFQGLGNIEAKEDQSRRVLNATREAFNNLGLPSSTISLNGRMGIGLLNQLGQENSLGEYLDVVSNKHSTSTGILNIPNFKHTPGISYKDYEISYHKRLATTLVHETFHAIDRCIAKEKMGEFKEDIKENKFLSEFSMYRLNKAEVIPDSSKAINEKMQNTIAKLYGNCSLQEYKEICKEKSKKLIEDVSLRLLKATTDTATLDEMSPEEKVNTFEDPDFKDNVLLLINNCKNRKNFKGIEGLTPEDNKTLLKDTNDICRQAGLLLNNTFNEDLIKNESEFSFILVNNDLAVLNQIGYEEDNHYWMSTHEVFARAVEGTIFTKELNNSTVQDPKTFNLSDEKRGVFLDLVHNMAKELNIEPIMEVKDTPVMNGAALSYFRSKTNGFLNTAAIKDDNLSNLNPIVKIEINKGLISNKNNEEIKNPRFKIQQ